MREDSAFMKQFLLLFCLFLGLAFTHSDEKERLTMRYVDQYASIAVMEMHRSGIPASIILAQGIHESNSGTSALATRANNHFGIKCKAYWRGDTYYHEDDDYDDKGRLLESCFRSYEEPNDSYLDHTDFLMHTPYYQKLFHLPRTDYQSWARGLKHCGYATDPKYAQKLIGLVEKFGLNKFDLLKASEIEKTGTVLETINDEVLVLPDNYRRSRYMDN
jgi:flagellum-specific peptidoglycan hydrolase FlgJ